MWRKVHRFPGGMLGLHSGVGAPIWSCQVVSREPLEWMHATHVLTHSVVSHPLGCWQKLINNPNEPRSADFRPRCCCFFNSHLLRALDFPLSKLKHSPSPRFLFFPLLLWHTTELSHTFCISLEAPTSSVTYVRGGWFLPRSHVLPDQVGCRVILIWSSLH